MIAIGLCLGAFVLTYWAGRHSLGRGLLVLFVFGYFYGILRANLLTVFSHFIFDASLVALYLSQFLPSSTRKPTNGSEALRIWTLILIGWPVLMVLMPFQPFLVSLAGLRGGAFFLPVLLLGARLVEKDLVELSYGLAILNLIAVTFAIAEYFTSVMQFFPLSPVTSIIYASGDVAGGFFRIPAIFSSAHAYGGTMIHSMPLVIGLWDHPYKRFSRVLAVLGMAAALLGVLLSATRQNFIVGVVMVLVTLMTTHAKGNRRLIFLLLIGVMAWTAATNTRLQRFKSLGDTDYVSERIAGSVNRGFWEILAEYPMGNGLGGGGTSIPYFLQGQVRNPIGMENGYALILCEQGIVGLLLWLAFISWFLGHARTAFAKSPWSNTRRMAWCLTAFSLSTAWIGLGMFNSIPSTVFLFLSMGWTMIPQKAQGSRVMEKLPRFNPYQRAYAQSAR